MVLLHLNCHIMNLSASLEIFLPYQAVYYYLLDNPVSGPSFVPTVIAALHPSNTVSTVCTHRISFHAHCSHFLPRKKLCKCTYCSQFLPGKKLCECTHCLHFLPGKKLCECTHCSHFLPGKKYEQ